jgi:hypothetical protein
MRIQVVEAQHPSITNDYVPLMFYLFPRSQETGTLVLRLLMLSLIRAGIANVLSFVYKDYADTFDKLERIEHRYSTRTKCVVFECTYADIAVAVSEGYLLCRWISAHYSIGPNPREPWSVTFEQISKVNKDIQSNLYLCSWAEQSTRYISAFGAGRPDSERRVSQLGLTCELILILVSLFQVLEICFLNCSL